MPGLPRPVECTCLAERGLNTLGDQVFWHA
jgi:hypothetical protein